MVPVSFGGRARILESLKRICHNRVQACRFVEVAQNIVGEVERAHGMTRSKYDELHDRFFTIPSSKRGTRYERLAAVVFKSLYERRTVIHNISLRGTSRVPHQIDVLIEADGKTKRILIEAKDFDKKGKRVGLSVVRNFRSVIEDIRPDQAFIVTCTGYTTPAREYAKAKGVKLAVLRAFEDTDWEGYIRRVPIQLHVEAAPRIERLDLNLDRAENDALLAEMQAAGIGMKIGGGVMFRDSDPVFLLSSSQRLHICEFLHHEIVARSHQPTISIDVNPDEWQIQVKNARPIRFTKFAVRATTRPPLLIQSEVVAPIAELILKGFGDHDVIVFADQLRAATFQEAPDLG
jgi:hypothetical protein